MATVVLASLAPNAPLLGCLHLSGACYGTTHGQVFLIHSARYYLALPRAVCLNDCLPPPSNLLPRFCVWTYTQISPSSVPNGVNGASGGGAARAHRPVRAVRTLGRAMLHIAGPPGSEVVPPPPPLPTEGVISWPGKRIENLSLLATRARRLYSTTESRENGLFPTRERRKRQNG